MTTTPPNSASTGAEAKPVVSPLDGLGSPIRVQLSRAKGWRMPPNTVSVARPTKFGNPWAVAAAIEIGYRPELAPAYCVDLFRRWTSATPCSLTMMLEDSDARRVALLAGLPELRGQNLACWCPLDSPCHADVLLELANADHHSPSPSEAA